MASESPLTLAFIIFYYQNVHHAVVVGAMTKGKRMSKKTPHLLNIYKNTSSEREGTIYII